MLKTVKIGRWFGIDTYIHWSFWLLMVFILLSESMAGGWRHGVAASAFLGFVFLCVYLHEIGHALAARGYGIRTHDITLLPFGGMARLESLPVQPHQELIVAIAGPIVNVVIAASLGTMLFLSDGLQQNLQDNPMRLGWVQQLFWVNITLAVFNLLPAFPMDGGRILRALLSYRLTHLRATQIAARVGRYLALIMIVLGLFYSFSLVLVGVFVFMAGMMELIQAHGRFAWENAVRQGYAYSPVDEQDGDIIEGEVIRGEVVDAEDSRRLN